MVLPTVSSSRKKNNVGVVSLVGILLLVLVLLWWVRFESESLIQHFVEEPTNATTSSSSVDQACIDLASTSVVEAEQLLSKHKRISDVSTAPMEKIQPPFHFGSTWPADKVIWHLSGDITNYNLIAQLPSSNDGTRVAFDMGANQGFYTYYLATLGFEVHSFEINGKNFWSLQHGQLFNAKDVSDRVHLYKLGLSNKVERMAAFGNGYDGFLKSADPGEDEGNTILSVTFDCLAHRLKLDLSKVDFVKIDVEGFEIAVLQGALQSLLGPNARVGALLAEIGPNRWERAGVQTEQGVEALQTIASKFKYSYIMIRHDQKCPEVLVKEGLLADENTITILTTTLYKIAQSEWSNLISKMSQENSDCIFWFAKQGPQPSASLANCPRVWKLNELSKKKSSVDTVVWKYLCTRAF